jgi:hypothetical protein
MPRSPSCHFFTCGANRTPPAPPPRHDPGAAHRGLLCSTRLRRRATLRAIWSCRLHSGYHTASCALHLQAAPMVWQRSRLSLVRRNRASDPCAPTLVFPVEVQAAPRSGGMACACGFSCAAVLSARAGSFLYKAGLRSRRYCERADEAPRSCSVVTAPWLRRATTITKWTLFSIGAGQTLSSCEPRRSRKHLAT